MRINSQNNQFVFNLPQGFITTDVEKKFQILMDKNFVQYLDVISYLNSNIKDIVFPSISYDNVEQKKFHGKNVKFREAGNITDKFQGEIDITFRSVDSHLNYFILLEICNIFYLQDNPNYLDTVTIDILDKDGDCIYTIKLDEVLIASLSEIRLSYNATEFNEQTFSLQISYNYIDIVWSIDRDELKEESIFDISHKKDMSRDTTKIDKLMEERKLNSNNRIMN